ncbi:BrnT family toxin [Candidatus Roizmanbacteria bacterium]|nr:BrnT family toxin [Candidatus Roizmanbacteria bacterium]
MLTVRKLIWDAWNISHIARHHVTPDEVETICHRDPLILRGQQKNRLVLIGSTEEERILAVILELKGRGTYYPITAYPADKKDIALYNRLKNKGGDRNNEKN